jgi:putative DNA primase/helicase
MKNLTRNRQHMIDLVEEYIGYILSGMEYHYNKVLVLAGDGNNGKTTVLNCIKQIVGKKNYTAISMKNLRSQFSPASLFGKLANFGEEASEDSLRETDMLKALTGNADIDVERKFENPFTMRNRAKLVITYNKIPYISDKSEGMARRLEIMPFDVNLTEEPALKIPDITRKIEKELSGILNRALVAYMRLRATDGFTIVPEAREEVQKIFKASDGVYEMWEDMVTKTGKEEDFLPIDELWTYYTSKVDPREGGGGGQRVERRGFGKKIGNYCLRAKGVELKKKKVNNEIVNVVVGVKWKDLEDQTTY